MWLRLRNEQQPNKYDVTVYVVSYADIAAESCGNQTNMTN